MSGEIPSSSPLSPDQVKALQKSANADHRTQGSGSSIIDVIELGIDAAKAAREIFPGTRKKK